MHTHPTKPLIHFKEKQLVLQLLNVKSIQKIEQIL